MPLRSGIELSKEQRIHGTMLVVGLVKDLNIQIIIYIIRLR